MKPAVKTVIATTIAALTLAATPQVSQAGQGAWTYGYGQGINEGSVTNGNGISFTISCPDAGLNNPASVLLEIPNLRGGENDATVGALVMVDNRNHSLTMRRRVLDQNQVIFDWDAASVGDRATLRTLIRALDNGRSVTIAMPSQSIRETFSLSGSRQALRGCHDTGAA